MNTILRKCKSLSISKLKRTSSYSSLRSKSMREEDRDLEPWEDNDEAATTITIFVGRSRRRYSVEKRHLDHPLLSTLIDRSSVDEVQVRCEVVLFDHLLWMLENVAADVEADTLEELAELYTY
ncbi:auxin-responsive protein SAUR77-like [Zingiber officinale]|uniref:Uncharacterized protein n=1 Tax=Zingiber officinale TaxID=94328 RepID=A0A8J5LR35_ZINOF|nr:auxin-responsive protein SAUR77-like [Zingiber officinale]KAG6526785.1 hypothetical protein ZIOFF_016786 [Zingiber officinale]